jgi:hypothetical protein
LIRRPCARPLLIVNRKSECPFTSRSITNALPVRPTGQSWPAGRPAAARAAFAHADFELLAPRRAGKAFHQLGAGPAVELRRAWCLNSPRANFVEVDLVAEMAVLNPFDFFLEPRAEKFPLVTTRRWITNCAVPAQMLADAEFHVVSHQPSDAIFSAKPTPDEKGAAGIPETAKSCARLIFSSPSISACGRTSNTPSASNPACRRRRRRS